MLIPETGRVVGLDLGSARVGVALSDARQRVSSALCTVARTGDATSDRRALELIVAEEEAVGVVVGLPLSLDGSVGPAAQAILDEIESWSPSLRGAPIETIDERFTTVAAHQALRAGPGARGGPSARQRLARQRVDSVAAALVLQSWLDRRQSAAQSAGSVAR